MSDFKNLRLTRRFLRSFVGYFLAVQIVLNHDDCNQILLFDDRYFNFFIAVCGYKASFNSWKRLAVCGGLLGTVKTPLG